MIFLKKFIFVFVFFLVFSQSNAVQYPFTDFSFVGELPKKTVNLAYKKVSETTAPEGSPIAGATSCFEESPQVGSVNITFNLYPVAPSIIYSSGFSPDVRKLTESFMNHWSQGRNAQSFLNTLSYKTSKITKKITSPIYEDINGQKKIIGKRTITFALADFFVNLESELKSLQNQGFWALFEKNHQLMSVISSILREGDLRDVEYSNILNIGKFFKATGYGFLEQDTPDYFSLIIGDNCLNIKKTDSPAEIKTKAAPFFQKVFSPSIREHLNTRFPEQPMSSDPVISVEGFSAAPVIPTPSEQTDAREAERMEEEISTVIPAQQDGSSPQENKTEDIMIPAEKKVPGQEDPSPLEKSKKKQSKKERFCNIS